MYIKRKNEQFLKEWKQKKQRKPLVIRGARQTGKTWLIEEFGKKSFTNFVKINLEKEPNLKKLFDKTEPIEIIRELEIIKNTPIRPGETLIFVDEIQEYAPAIVKLRYFFEDTPEYHIIAAGSLLEFVLEQESISFPVGRVEFLYLYPMTFEEFLGGQGNEQLLNFIKSINIDHKISEELHNQLRNLLESYLLIGGMPEVVSTFLDSNSYLEVESIKESIIETYRDDFKKYSKRVNVDNLDLVFREAPRWIGRRLNLSKMGPGEIGSREAGTAINLLQRAMILYRVNRAKNISFPLIPYKKAQPKMIFLDLGLVQFINHISKEILQSENYNSIYKGGFAEQLVGQELLPILGKNRKPELFYWQRNAKGAIAETDFILPFSSYLLPVEVKAGRGTTLFSTHQFMAKYNAPLAIRIYDGPAQLETLNISNPSVKYKLLSIPLYMVSELTRLVEHVLK